MLPARTNQGSKKIRNGTRCYVLVEVVFLPLTTTVDLTFVAGIRRISCDATLILGADARPKLSPKNTKESVGGNPKGSAVKKNGRGGTCSSGSSKGNPELGFANDSRRLLAKIYIYMTSECCVLIVPFRAYQLKTECSPERTLHHAKVRSLSYCLVE